MKQVVVALSAALALGACGDAAAPADTAEAAEASAVKTIDVAALAAMQAAGTVQLIDVRTPEEFAEGHIEGAVNMPVETFDAAAIEHIAGKQTILYCRSGRRSEHAAEMLAAKDGSATHLDGGILAWEEAGQPTAE